LILELKKNREKLIIFQKMQTTTCKKCGKFDLPIKANTSYCPICCIKIKNPIPDNFENQSKLSEFFPIVPQKREVVKVVAISKKFKQTKLK
jgi:PHP family Zn ribbon phosphoesterase